MSRGVGSYLDTLAQMHDLIGQLETERKHRRAAEDVLIDQLRRHEYDRLQEQYCALKEQLQR